MKKDVYRLSGLVEGTQAQETSKICSNQPPGGDEELLPVWNP